MALFAYIDVRPYLFLGGLPLFVLLCLLARRALRRPGSRGKTVGAAALAYAVLFAVFLTRLGPFMGQEALVEHLMTWEISDVAGEPEPKVELRYVDYPGHFVFYHSAELAEHLQKVDQPEVAVLFETSSNYGRVKGFNSIEVAGLQGWASTFGGSGSRMGAEPSPWD